MRPTPACLPSTLGLCFRAVFTVLSCLLLLATQALAGPSTRFTAKVTGQGPDVILIPGLSSPASVWDGTVAHLEGTHRVHVLQVAGFAGAPVGDNAEGAIVASLAEQIATYIADQKLKAPAIIGHSLGGATALMLAARHPAAPGRVLSVDALPFFPLIMNPMATVETVRPMADALRDRIAAASPEQFAQEQTTTMRRLIKTEARRAPLVALSSKSDIGVTARAMHELMTTDLRGELAAIRVPLTVVYAYDQAYGVPVGLIDLLYTSSYGGATGAKLVRIDNSFHFIMFDQPEKFIAAVDEFLR